jgi:hypothetical protein
VLAASIWANAPLLLAVLREAVVEELGAYPAAGRATS